MSYEDDDQPHCHGIAECRDCDWTWTAVWPLGAMPLQCPNCDSTHTDREAR